MSLRPDRAGQLDQRADSGYVASDPDGVAAMTSLTIRNLDDSLKTRLRARAAHHGRSMEEEARQILREALGEPSTAANLADLAESLFGAHGVDLDAHPPVPAREPPDFRS
jgi:antitoxin FitA